MATKTITFSLDTASITRAIKEMDRYIEDVKQKITELVKTLTEEGVRVASVQVAVVGAVDTGELSDSFIGFYDEESHVGIIRSTADYAVFVEYGTGIVGAQGPQHPEMDTWEPDGGWNHDHNNHGEEGWKYISERDGKLHWTAGMVSRPFMYETYKELQLLARQLAVEIFNK